MPTERTILTPSEEVLFQLWARDPKNGIQNLDLPDTFYDYRGYWKDIASKGRNESGVNSVDGLLHFVDTYKQHGHPTFSAESKYSRGLQDGGQWIGETLVTPPMPSHGAAPQSIEELLAMVAASLPKRRR